MMKPILCDTCNIKIGEIEEDALVSAGENGELEKYCRDCKHKIITVYFDDENQLINLRR